MHLTAEAENPGIAAMKRASRIAVERGITEMTLDEINEEIAATRKKKVSMKYYAVIQSFLAPRKETILNS